MGLPELAADEVDETLSRLLRRQVFVGRPRRVVVPPAVAKPASHDDRLDGHLGIPRRVGAARLAERRSGERVARD